MFLVGLRLFKGIFVFVIKTNLLLDVRCGDYYVARLSDSLGGFIVLKGN